MTPGSHLTVQTAADFDGIEQAACAGTNADLWFPARGDNRALKAAKAVCNNECPVQQACLEYALDNNEHWGVWGGASEGQRRRIRRNKKVTI